jgi:hypothetical protein
MHNQFIGIYEDAVDGGLCDSIINEFNRYSDLGLTIAGITGLGEASQIKKSEDINILAFPSWHDHAKALSEELLACYKIYGDTYVGVKSYTAPHILTALQLQKYDNQQRGAYYQFHCEVNPTTCDRVTTFIIYLNDIAEGGETEFLEQKLRIKPKKGTIAIFPAYFTHVHRGNPVLSDEDKYIATGWYNFA